MQPNIYCLCPEVFGKSHGLFQKGKKCTCKQICIHFLKIALSFWNSMAPSSCQQFPLNSCFTQLPSLCGTGFREFSASKESKGASLWCSGKESAYQSSRGGFYPWFRKIPWRRRWQPPPVFLPGESHGQRSLVGYSPRGDKESDMTEHSRHTYTQRNIILAIIKSIHWSWESQSTF